MQYGFSVAGVGDLNGNGKPDVVVGAPEWAAGQCTRDGAIEAVELTPGTGMPTQLYVAFNGSPFGGGARFGYAVAGIGDATQDPIDACDDGLPDFAVGMPFMGAPGMIRVFRGRRNQTQPSCNFGSPFVPVGYAQATNPAGNDFFGYSIVGLGNATGDAHDDFVVGAPWASPAAHVFRGGASLSLTPCFTVVAGAGTCRDFGTALSGRAARSRGVRARRVGDGESGSESRARRRRSPPPGSRSPRPPRVYSSASPLARPVFQRAEPLTDQDVVEITTRLNRRILRHLTRCGRLPKAEPDDDEAQPDEPLLAELYAASVQGRVAIGEETGTSVERLGQRRDARPLFLPGELCCDMDGSPPSRQKTTTMTSGLLSAPSSI